MRAVMLYGIVFLFALGLCNDEKLKVIKVDLLLLPLATCNCYVGVSSNTFPDLIL